MPRKIHVDAYSGFKSNERPRQFRVDEDVFPIEFVEDQWRTPAGEFFRVRTTNGQRFVLRYFEPDDRWELQSNLDGAALLSRPNIELVKVILEGTRRAEQRIVGCEKCRPDESDVPFDSILSEVTGVHGAYEFVLTAPARCPNCRAAISEKTPVAAQGGIKAVARVVPG